MPEWIADVIDWWPAVLGFVVLGLVAAAGYAAHAVRTIDKHIEEMESDQ